MTDRGTTATRGTQQRNGTHTIADEIPWPEEPDDLAPNSAGNEGAINHRMTALRVEREARRRLDAEERPPIEPPPVRNLDALLAEPDAPTAYVVDQLAPANGRVMLSAQYKAGKTTLVGNLIRSLADREPFLDRFEITRPPNRIALIDTELDDSTLRRWLRDQNITNRAAVADIVGLRGRVAALNLLDDRTRAQWATRLGDLGCDYLALDCLRPVLDALGLDEHRDAGQFLVAFDALLTEAGISDAFMVQHMGHSGERARGDSRLQDWPDATWRLVRENEEPHAPRFFSAYGRDVDIREGRLSYTTATRHLSYVAGSRKDSKAEAALPDVIAVLAAVAQKNGEPLSGRKLEDAVNEASTHGRNEIRDAIKLAIQHGHVTVTPGANRAQLHAITHPCMDCGHPLTAGQKSRHHECATKS